MEGLQVGNECLNKMHQVGPPGAWWAWVQLRGLGEEGEFVPDQGLSLAGLGNVPVPGRDQWDRREVWHSMTFEQGSLVSARECLPPLRAQEEHWVVSKLALSCLLRIC